MKYRILERKFSRVAVLIENQADDAMVDAAIAYSQDCGDPIIEISNATASMEISANAVHSHFGLDRD